MAAAADLLIGEFIRTLDERFRLAIPPELIDPLLAAGPKLVLAKERAGCLSRDSSDQTRLREVELTISFESVLSSPFHDEAGARTRAWLT